MSQLYHNPEAVRIQSTGVPHAGAKILFYLTGTTTKTDTYEDSARGTPHDNPVVAGADGQFAPIYLDPAVTYRAYITESDDTLIKDVDPIGTPLTASDILVVDAGEKFDDTEVEAVLADIGTNYAKKTADNTFTGHITMNGKDIKMADNILERAEIKDYSITHNILTQAAEEVAVDCSTGNSFFFVLTENAEIILSNPSPDESFCQIVIRIQQDGAGGGYTVGWEGSVSWPAATAPVVTAANDAIDVIYLHTDDAGVNWFGTFSQVFG